MALFVPTTGGSNGWGSGFGALAEAFAQAPLNQMRVRESQMNAANMAADNARAEAQLELQRQQEARNAANEAIRIQLLRDAEARQAEAAAQALATARSYDPLKIEGQGLANQGQTLQNEGFGIANQFATQNNPILLKKNEAEAASSQAAADLARRRNAAIDPARYALTQQTMGIVEQGLPEFDVGRSLGQSGLPPPVTLPGMDPNMDYPQGGQAMDDIERRNEIMGRIWDLTSQAVLGEGGVPKEWAKDTATDVLSGQRDAIPDPAAGAFEGASIEAQQLNVIQNYALKKQNGAPTTPQEDQAYALAYNALYGPGYQAVADATGTPYAVAVPKSVPGGLPQPMGAAQAPAAAQPLPNPNAPPPPPRPSMGATLPGPVPAPGPAPMPPTGGPGQSLAPQGFVPKTPTVPKKTEFQDKANMFSTRMGVAFDQLAPLLGYDRASRTYDPSKSQVKGFLNAGQMWADRQVTDWIGSEFTGAVANESQEKFMNARTALLNPILRFDSGAAIPEQEYPRYMMEFIPGAMTDPAADQQKFVRIEATIAAMEEIGRKYGVDPTSLTDEQLQQMKASGEIDSTIARHMEELGGTYVPLKYGAPAQTGAPAPAAPAQTYTPSPEDDALVNKYLPKN
jgi:hypothetical protein